MVKVIEVDNKNVPVQCYSAEVTLPGDVITMMAGIPELGTPEFDEWLRQWHEAHNGFSNLAPVDFSSQPVLE